nr:DUF3726 domain-containing protein [Jannaschia sp. Os4]
MGELQALVRAAVRGAGRDWGTAAEAARGARWLAARGVDPTPSLAALLSGPPAGRPTDPRAPAWDGPLDPLRAGLALADFAPLRAPRLSLRGLRHPLLLLPFVADAAAATGLTLTLTWAGATAATDGDALSLAGDDADEADAALAPGGCGPARPAAARARPAAWDALAALAALTHAPATAASRRGAGADDDPLE